MTQKQKVVRRRLTANFQVDGLAVLADGVGGAAQVLAGVGELHVLQREGGEPGVAKHHNVAVQTLREERGKKREEEEKED